MRPSRAVICACRPAIVPALCAALFCFPAPSSAKDPSAIQVEVDARDVTQKIVHSRLVLPVSPGPLTLKYAEWLPGEHGPTGPINELTGLKFRAGERALAWQRDLEDMYAFHLDVPEKTRELTVDLDFLMPVAAGGFTAGASATTQLAILNWHQFILFPEGADADAILYAASLRLPDGWKFGTSLHVARESRSLVEFKPVSLTILVDSPVLTGAHFRTVQISEDPPVRMCLAADGDAMLGVTPAVTDQYRALVREAEALFGGHHWVSYTFLVALSEHVGHFALEHHESSDNRAPERFFVDEETYRWWAEVLPHEFAHSWNGKYRRPRGLAPGTYEKPMHGDLLWVYEGLTNYLGTVLTVRSGMHSPATFRESLALTAEEMDHQAGRTWRPLSDTAVAAQVLFDASKEGASWRRGVDFYPEGTLLWLEVDVMIREQTRGARSLDDFCRAFFGGGNGKPEVLPYDLDDLIAALEKVSPYDWRGHFEKRLQSLDAQAPKGGIEAGGWTLAYTDSMSSYQEAGEATDKILDETASIGVEFKEDGAIQDVIPGAPAATAGVSPGTRLVAVNGRRFSAPVLRDALVETSTLKKPVELLVEDGEFFSTHRLAYTGGKRYPHLVRRDGRPDVLSVIASPLSK